ncbi:DUF4232 domain-containing protein [Streptomyces sp. NBC_01235]|uniref:DUF4232 domain-containing protein n=1 Tax=Streptomyces sp. NBC_01235 TaxID=2903788 RepID=UPI002E14180F|nr:DUF4232 domain-containing protein [Streptomyces sp. NBC_01235]
MNAAARKSHMSWKSYALGAAAVAALLASTACESSAADGSGNLKPSDQPSTTNPAKPGETGSSKPSGISSNTGGNGGSDHAGGAGGDSATAACAEADLAYSATNEDKQGEPVRHLLLTVQNAGDKKCNVYHYPYVKIGNAQAPTPVIKDSDPKALATLAPGEEAYAALLVAGGARDEYEAKSITLTLHGSKLGSKAGAPVDVPMPVDKLYADDGQLVTYWTTASGYALDFIMSK